MRQGQRWRVKYDKQQILLKKPNDHFIEDRNRNPRTV